VPPLSILPCLVSTLSACCLLGYTTEYRILCSALLYCSSPYSRHQEAKQSKTKAMARRRQSPSLAHLRDERSQNVSSGVRGRERDRGRARVTTAWSDSVIRSQMPNASWKEWDSCMHPCSHVVAQSCGHGAMVSCCHESR